MTSRRRATARARTSSGGYLPSDRSVCMWRSTRPGSAPTCATRVDEILADETRASGSVLRIEIIENPTVCIDQGPHLGDVMNAHRLEAHHILFDGAQLLVRRR